jgi:hypothetical protein
MSEIKLNEEQLDHLLEQLSGDAGYIGDAIRDISNFEGGKKNAFIGMSQGLFEIAAALREHTEYLKSRDPK